jgi:hypothetical protein
MSSEQLAPYEALASLLERELQLVSERNFDELAEIRRVQDALQSSLPATPPAVAAATLYRCVQLHKRVEIELLRVREVLLSELGRVQHGQRAASGYAPMRSNGRRVAATA